MATLQKVGQQKYPKHTMMAMLRSIMTKELQASTCYLGSTKSVDDQVLKKAPLAELFAIKLCLMHACQMKHPNVVVDEMAFKDAVKSVCKNPLDQHTKGLRAPNS